MGKETADINGLGVPGSIYGLGVPEEDVGLLEGPGQHHGLLVVHAVIWKNSLLSSYCLNKKKTFFFNTGPMNRVCKSSVIFGKFFRNECFSSIHFSLNLLSAFLLSFISLDTFFG